MLEIEHFTLGTEQPSKIIFFYAKGYENMTLNVLML